MDKCNTEKIFKVNNIKATKPRLNLMSNILEFDKPFCVAELHANSSHLTNIELTTVYRFILLLLEKKVIREIGSYNGSQFYEMACFHNPIHPHFFCYNCREIKCLNQLSADDFITLSKYCEKNFINEIKITLGGFCENCKNSI